MDKCACLRVCCLIIAWGTPGVADEPPLFRISPCFIQYLLAWCVGGTPCCCLQMGQGSSLWGGIRHWGSSCTFLSFVLFTWSYIAAEQSDDATQFHLSVCDSACVPVLLPVGTSPLLLNLSSQQPLGSIGFCGTGTTNCPGPTKV